MTPKKFKLAVLVSGRGSNLQAIIDSIKRNDLQAEISLVISNVNDAYALKRAQEHGLEAIFLNPQSYHNQNSYENILIEKIQSKSVDLVCLAGYMRILGKNFIKAFSGRIINIHPSYLPTFKGLNAQEQAIKARASFSGCTVHFVNEKTDGGEIILQKKVIIEAKDDTESLSKKILREEHIVYPKALEIIASKILKIKH